jgi:hypothetical protein
MWCGRPAAVAKAIDFYLAPHPEPERIPYFMTSRLLRNIQDKIESEAGKTDLGRVLANRQNERGCSLASVTSNCTGLIVTDDSGL